MRTKRIGIRLTPEELMIMESARKKSGETLTAFIIRAVKTLIEKED